MSNKALVELEAAGLLVDHSSVPRELVLVALKPIYANLPAAARDAIRVAAQHVVREASDEELMAAKNACWEEMKANDCDFPDERANQYRAAMFAVESGPMQYAWQDMGYFVLFATNAGVDDATLAGLLKEHYNAPHT